MNFKRGLGQKKSPLIPVLLFLGLATCVGSLLNAKNESYYSTIPTITHINNTTIEVSWPTHPDANEKTHYQVLVGHTYFGHSTKDTKQIVNGIKPGSNVDIKVVTYNDGKLEGISKAASIIMQPASIDSFFISEIATNSFNISWSGVDTATSYNIYNGSTIIGSKKESGTSNNMTLSGFEPGQKLNICMTAVNKSGESPKSDYQQIDLLPDAQLTLTVPNKNITSTGFKLKWSKVKYGDGYKVLINDQAVATLSKYITEYDVKDLDAGTIVNVKVSVFNQSGEDASDESLIVQLKPATPILTVTDISSYSCVLTWSVANGANNYKIFENGDNAIYNVPSTITNVTVTEAVNEGATYKYKIRAVNDIGESEDSNVVEVTYTAPEQHSTETTASVSAPIFTGRCALSSSIQIPTPVFSKNLSGNFVVAVYFPDKLRGPKLSVESEYLELLASSPELSSVKFYAIFTNEVPQNHKKPNNLKYKKASPDLIKIPGEIPVVKFYSDEGKLRDTIMISMAIMTNTDIYKALPELMEKNSNVIHLYNEFANIHNKK